jgi:hypothetical protein
MKKTLTADFTDFRRLKVRKIGRKEAQKAQKE